MTKPHQIRGLLDDKSRASKRPPIRNLALIGSMNLALLPTDAITIAWIVSGAALMVVVAAVFLLRKLYAKKHTMSLDKEKALWEQVEQAARARMSKRERVENLSTLRRKPQAGSSERSSGDHARSVQALFQTLREDRPVGSGSEAGTPAPKDPYTTAYEPPPVTQHGMNTPQRLDDSVRHDPSQRAPKLHQPETAIPPLRHAPMSGQPSVASLQQSRPLHVLQGGFDASLTSAGLDLPSAIRQDATHRLEADLAWVHPQTYELPEWAPGFVRRATREKQARHFHRLSRQVALANHLMQSPDKQLQRIGVETAIQLEKQLHQERAKNTRGRRALRK